LRGPPRSHAIPLGLILVLGLGALSPLWLDRGIAYSPCSDIIAEHLSNMEVYARSIRDEGRFPLWNPAMNCGAPAFANPQSMILYPLSALYLILPPDRATNLFILISYLAAGGGMFLLARRLFSNNWVAAFCAAAYMLSFRSYCMVYAGWLPKMPMLTLAPLIFWATSRTVEKASGGRTALLAIVVALGWVQGDMQLFAYCMASSAVLVLAGLLRHQRGSRAVPTLAAFCGMALGTLLAAPAILPRVEFARLSTRTTPDFGFFLGHSPDAGDFSTLLDPRDDSDRRPQFWEDNFYFGLGLYPLCVVGLVARLRHAALPAAGALAAVVLCFNTPVLRFLFDYAPGFAMFRQPSRALILAQLAVVVIAGMGLESLIESRAATGRIRRLAGLAAVTSVGLVLLAVATHAGAISIVVAAAVTAAAGLMLIAPHRALLAVALLAALAPLDAMVRMFPRLTMISLDEAFPPARFHAQLVRSPTSGRTAAIGRTAIPYGQAGHFKIDLLNGYASLNLRHYIEYVTLLQTGIARPATTPVVWVNFASAARPDLLPTLNIRFIVANEPLELETIGYQPIAAYRDQVVFDFNVGLRPERMFLFEAAVPLAPGHFARSARVLAAGADSLSVLESSPPSVANLVGPVDLPKLDFAGGSIQLARRGLNVYQYDLDARGREFVILSQVWYPGWRAILDGQPISIYRVNHALLGCAVPPGRHRLILEMTSPMLRIGLWLSAGAAAMLLAIAAVPSLRRSTAIRRDPAA